MKQFFGALSFLALLFLIFFGKQTITALLTPPAKPLPTTKGVVWPTSKPVIAVAKMAPKKVSATLDGLLADSPAATQSVAVPTLDPSGTDLFESLMIKKSTTLVVPTYSADLEANVPASLKLVRAQPSVYKILQYGNLELNIPDNVQVDDDALLRAYAADGGVPQGDDRSKDPALTKYLWATLISDPAKYLSFDGEKAAHKFENELMASGTGFLVSRDGIVLTNAHVIGDMEDQPLTNDPIVLASLIGDSCDAFMTDTIKLFGGEPAPDMAPQVATSLLQWFAANGRMTGKFSRAELVLQYKKKSVSAFEAFTVDLNELFTRPPQPIVAPLEVLFKGEALPGKDVAILRASKGDFDVIDRAVCLPLGDSEDVLAGTKVQALGFPGIAFNANIMDPAAAYRVSAQDGQVANTKRMTGGYDAIEMTADINHGDSGGPVVNVADGCVIGLNVGAATEKSTGHTLAIPINVAKEMLADLKIELDPGPATALWIDALKAYDAKQYSESADILARLVRLQAEWTNLDGTMIKDISGDLVPQWESSVNPYIVDLLKRAQAKSK